MRFALRFLRSRNAVPAVAALAAFLILSAPSALKAFDGCQRRIAHADHRLHEAIERHGYRSPQARHWRRELRAAREYCWRVNHRWWDEDNRRWHGARDWDEDDHYRDRR